MYAVIRAGGKQYRVAPGDVIRVEKAPSEKGRLEFDVLAVSGSEGQIGRPQGEARVVGTVVEEGRGDKVLVFHYNRKKQYKKLQGHRQPFTAVRITEIAFDGQKFTAPEEAARPKKEKKVQPAAGATEASAGATAETAEHTEKKAAAHKKSASARGGKTAAKKSASSKSSGKKKK